MALAMAVSVTIPAFATTSYSNPGATVSQGKSGSGYVIVSDNSARVVALRAVGSDYIYNDDGDRVGYWLHGKRDQKVVSEYKTYIGEGRASVTNGEGVYKDGGWVGVGQWSKASAKWTSAGTNKANYDYR